MIYLLYHELELPDRPPCDRGPGYPRYVVTAREFQRQMSWLEAARFECVSVAQALGSRERGGPTDRKSVAITFDDGCASDHAAAAPTLKRLGFNATFFVIAGRIDHPGYLGRREIRELSDEGFDIGCHSMTHRHLPNLDANELRVEIAEAKERIEEITGHRVTNLSCPSGRWSADVARMAEDVGYDAVVTSRVGANGPTSNPFRLCRVPVRRGISMEQFDRMCRGERLFLWRVRAELLEAAKGILGDSRYDGLRRMLLRPGSPPRSRPD